MALRTDDQILQRLEEAINDPSAPRFPVSRTYPIKHEYFSQLYVKDESTNRTGTHKDRKAWTIVLSYYDILKTNQNRGIHAPLPSYSIISAGSAALAI